MLNVIREKTSCEFVDAGSLQWLSAPVEICPANLPIPLLPNQGAASLDTPTISGNEGCASFEAAGRKLEPNKRAHSPLLAAGLASV